METLTRGKVVHLVNTDSHGYTLCGKRVDCHEVTLHSVNDVVPNCPRCLKFHFNFYKTTQQLRQESDVAQRDRSRLLNALGLLVEAQRTKNVDSDCEESKKGTYPFIPMSVGGAFSNFTELEKILRKERRWSGRNAAKVRFLDAGCGIGNILLIAQICDLAEEYHGIEFFKKTAAQGRAWLGINKKAHWSRRNLKILRGDILTFENYSDYDIVYFYCPMSDPRLQIRFEERLEDEMKVGAVLLPRLKKGRAINDDSRFERISVSGVYETCFIKIDDGPRIHSQIKEIDKKCKCRKSEREERIIKFVKAGTIKG